MASGPLNRWSWTVLALMPLLLGLAAAVADSLDGSDWPVLLLIGALAVALVGQAALRRRSAIVRRCEGRPDERAYRSAYRMLSGLLALLLLGAMINDALNGQLLTGTGVLYILICLVFTAMLLPAAMLSAPVNGKAAATAAAAEAEAVSSCRPRRVGRGGARPAARPARRSQR